MLTLARQSERDTPQFFGPSDLKSRAGAATALAYAIEECEPGDACQLMTAALCDLSDGLSGPAFIDILARVMGGPDGNAAPDIAHRMRNLDLFRRATGAHVMLVHHTGKANGRGARSHSSARAATDTDEVAA